MAVRSAWSSLWEEKVEELPDRSARSRSRAGEKLKEARSVMTKEYTDKQKLLINIHRIWRIANWLIVTWLANQAFAKALDMLGISRTGRLSLIFLVASLTFAGIMVVFAEGTGHDRLRRKSGQNIAVVSEVIMLIPVVFDTIKILGMDVINAVSIKLGGEVFNVRNYKNSSLGWLWILNLVLAGVVCVSLLREEQSTDQHLGFARTPQKRDIVEMKDPDGNTIVSFEKFKR